MEHYDSDGAETSGQVRSCSQSAASLFHPLQPVVQYQSSQAAAAPFGATISTVRL